MTETSGPVRPVRRLRLQGPDDPPAPTSAAEDLRVSMVLSVLGGRSVENVAQTWDVEVSLLQRWVSDFVVAGSAVITNRPEVDDARQRDRLLAAFAHELRTPVTVARGWAMMLEEGEVPDHQVAGSLTHLSDALTRLHEHILDVQLAASASLGRLQVHVEAVDAASLCRDLVDGPEPRAGGDLVVHADPRLFSRVLRDLWATVRRAPEPDGAAIDVVESEGWHEFRVVRTGSPISHQIVTALFDPFGANDDATGITMGLYTARAITVAHGGFLGAEGDDDGTVLLARLPREPASAPVPPGHGPDRDGGGRP